VEIEIEQLTNADWFREQQKILKLTNVNMAYALCCSLSHVEHMRSNRRPVTEKTRRIIKLLHSNGKSFW